MLDNYTTDQFFEGVDNYDDLLDGFAAENGRVCITDNITLETYYNKYVEARQELLNEYYKWR